MKEKDLVIRTIESSQKLWFLDALMSLFFTYLSRTKLSKWLNQSLDEEQRMQ